MIPQRRSAQLALQASLLLAMEPDVRWRRIKDIATALGVPATYLAKVSQSLTQAGLLRSVRGPGGGYHLARGLDEISVADIICAVDEPIDATKCGGRENCNNGERCMTHDLWASLNGKIFEYLESVNLSQLIASQRTDNVVPLQDKRGGKERQARDAAGIL